LDRDTIAAQTGVTPGQVSAVAAHVSMGTYKSEPHVDPVGLDPEQRSKLDDILQRLHHGSRTPAKLSDDEGIVVGVDVESNAVVRWNPDSTNGTANPHLLILGESGFGKTYAISCLLAELAQCGISSIVFDYAQGFSLAEARDEFLAYARPVELAASRDGLAINPLQMFPSDIHGPVNVAQRVADTFQRVYRQIGVQQHAVLRQAVLDVFRDAGITPGNPSTWEMAAPGFGSLQAKLLAYANNPAFANRKIAAAIESHISTMFVFNTFRDGGLRLDWERFIASQGSVFVIQLKGLEQSLERAVTEFLLWNLIGFIESLGPGPMRCFAVLDEAHKLAFSAGSPTEKLLREGRKFGIGVILASQQAEDFNSVAFSNTATKLVFQIADDKSIVSRQLAKKVAGLQAFAEIAELITRLPRGCGYFLTQNVGRVVRIQPIEERSTRWSRLLL
jgi:DNA phosphorothioation-dependent restriction protein DptH